MNGPASASTDVMQRSALGCLCCGSDDLYRETTVTSAFLAKRALGKKAELTKLAFCRECQFRFFDRGLSETEASRYYDGYRNQEYFRERNRHEPFYTWGAHQNIATFLGSEPRRQALAAVLSEACRSKKFENVLDFGGGDGQLIADLPAQNRAVYDISNEPTMPGIGRISDLAEERHKWDVVVCAQVLEHVGDPGAIVATLSQLLAPEGLLYLEVPDEMWSNHTAPGWLRDRWLAWLTRWHAPLIVADTVSTACRILLGILPPFGFIPMREHLQYFSEQALVALCHRCELTVIRSGRNAVGQLYVVATRARASLRPLTPPRTILA